MLKVAFSATSVSALRVNAWRPLSVSRLRLTGGEQIFNVALGVRLLEAESRAEPALEPPVGRQL